MTTATTLAYYATFKAHGTTFQTLKRPTLAEVETDVFGRASAPQRSAVRFWQVLTESTG